MITVVLRYSIGTLLNSLFCSDRLEQILLQIIVSCTTIIVQANVQQIVSEDGITGLTQYGMKLGGLMQMMVGVMMTT